MPGIFLGISTRPQIDFPRAARKHNDASGANANKHDHHGPTGFGTLIQSLIHSFSLFLSFSP